MKRHLITAVLAGLTFLCGLLVAILAVWTYWYVRNWGYNHAPSDPGDPHDAAAYVLIAMELFFGLPLGVVLGLLAGVVVVVRRQSP